ncbi:cupin domain-containing protein [Haloarchaeobius sp. TZWWS8]|uniref:cupin domain-containing protein n=1 Tax=Haloarchaeobius sp. TZWWS8 TaxID=3446121 RepID=UPI003EBACD9A
MDSTVTVIGAGELTPSPVAPPGVTWETVFDTDRVLLVRTRVDGDWRSGWHSHGSNDAYGVVLVGRARFEYGADGALAQTAGTGDFFTFPAGTTYRTVNAGEGELVALVALVGSGVRVVVAEGPGAGISGEGPTVAHTGDLTPTGNLANLTRLTPFPDAPVQQIRGHAEGRIESSWHHHGDNDVFGYVIDGEGYVEWGHGDDERRLARAGEFFHIPAGLVHRDVNPSDDEQDYLLWLTGSEPRVVHVPAPALERQ